MEGLAEEFNIGIRDHVLELPGAIGEGRIVAQNLSADLSYLLMDFRMEEDLEFRREAGGRHGFSLSFNQVLTKDGRKAFGSDIFLSDTHESVQIRIPAGSTVQRLILFFSAELIGQYLGAALIGQLQDFAHKHPLAANKYFISLPHRETLKEIFDMESGDPLGHVRRLALIVRLTEKFLHSFIQQERGPLPRKLKKNDLESVRHIEQILSSRLEGFPSLESLAHEVYMSTSKLKTLFKEVYGFTLYDYYNKSRLQRAKDMLATGQFSIKQAGCEIGFSNLSHFAKAFRKEYGMLPRDMIRSPR